MSEHFAVSISISQGKYDTTASCCLLHAAGDRETMMEIKWPVLPPQTDPENAGEWLFNILSDLVANFDAHEVQSAETRPRPGTQGAGK